MKTQVMQGHVGTSARLQNAAEFRTTGAAGRGCKHYLLLLAVIVLAMVPAFGGNLTTLYNTGVNDAGAPLNAGVPNGSVDPHYHIVSGPSTFYGSFTGGLGYTTAIASGWWSPPASAEWINPISNGTGAPSWAPTQGYYDYETSFDICCTDPESVVIKGQFAADNNACIWVNGVNTNICTPTNGFSGPTAFQLDAATLAAVNSAFVPGVNRIDFMVYNSKASFSNGTPSGLVVVISSATGQ